MTGTLVSVCMITYGHEKFIEEAINSILMQQCDFEVELIVANDFSPDRTDEVIQRILNTHPKSSWIKYVKQEKNIGMMPNMIAALQSAKGKYIAFCDGDDYWTDPLKLQKQVDFLENNLTYSICWTKYRILDQYVLKGVETFKKLEFNKGVYNVTLDSLFDPYVVHTSTCLFRNDINILVLSGLDHAKENTIYTLLLIKGGGAILDFESSVYRYHDGGVFSAKTELSKITENYYNLKEINNVLLENKIPKLKQIESSFLNLMLFLAFTSSSKDLKKGGTIKNIYFEIIRSSPWKYKYLASKEILKQVYLRFRVGKISNEE